MLLEPAFHWLFCLKFSFKLVTFSKSYRRKQKWMFFSEHSAQTKPHRTNNIELVISEKNNLKIVSHLTKTETSLGIWLNIVTIVARSVRLLPSCMREDVHATHQLHCQWRSGQCHAKHAENAASVHNTCLNRKLSYRRETARRFVSLNI